MASCSSIKGVSGGVAVDVIVDAINHVVLFISSVAGTLLPDDPFRGVISDMANNSDLSAGLAMLNWFVPFGNLATFLAIGVSAILAARLSFL